MTKALKYDFWSSQQKIPAQTFDDKRKVAVSPEECFKFSKNNKKLLNIVMKIGREIYLQTVRSIDNHGVLFLLSGNSRISW